MQRREGIFVGVHCSTFQIILHWLTLFLLKSSLHLEIEEPECIVSHAQRKIWYQCDIIDKWTPCWTSGKLNFSVLALTRGHYSHPPDMISYQRNRFSSLSHQGNIMLSKTHIYSPNSIKLIPLFQIGLAFFFSFHCDAILLVRERKIFWLWQYPQWHQLGYMSSYVLWNVRLIQVPW